MQDFCPRINICSNEIVLKQSCDELWFVKKCRNHTFNVNFLCQKWTEFFQKKKHLRISIEETIFCKKTHFFLTQIFEPLYFLKSCPIFDKLAPPYSKNTMVSFEYIDFWPKILLFRTHHLWNSTTELIIIAIPYFQGSTQ